ncbi:MAG: cytidine deaminase [Bacteroidales bacterium]
MKNKTFSIQFYEVEGITQLPEDEQMLVQEANRMTENAYAPYSKFYVGAAILLDNGEIIKGSNQENGAYPSGLCAERVAAFAASAMYPGAVMKKIAVSATSERLLPKGPVSPCGACRQVLLEYESAQQSPLKVLLAGKNGKIYIIEKMKDLLPLDFSGKDLKNNR